MQPSRERPFQKYTFGDSDIPESPIPLMYSNQVTIYLLTFTLEESTHFIRLAICESGFQELAFEFV